MSKGRPNGGQVLKCVLLEVPKLNILQHKSYHPYSEKNKERVRRDEAAEQARVEAEEQRSLQADAEARLALLRGRDAMPASDMPPASNALVVSSSSRGLPEDPFYASQPDGDRRAVDRKGKARASKGDDMRALDRLLLSGGSSSSKSAEASGIKPAAGEESLSFYGKDGHLNFWASEEMRPPQNAPDKKVKKTPEELEREDPYTMYLSRPARELEPWYTDPQLRKIEDREGRDKTIDRKREQRLRKDVESKTKRDPLTHIESLFSRVSSSSASRSPARPPPPIGATPTDKRLHRESSERERALALIAEHRRRSAPSSEPSTPAVSVRSASATPGVRSGGWTAEGGAYGASASSGYGESRFYPDDLRRIERERERRRNNRR